MYRLYGLLMDVIADFRSTQSRWTYRSETVNNIRVHVRMFYWKEYDFIMEAIQYAFKKLNLNPAEVNLGIVDARKRKLPPNAFYNSYSNSIGLTRGKDKFTLLKNIFHEMGHVYQNILGMDLSKGNMKEFNSLSLKEYNDLPEEVHANKVMSYLLEGYYKDKLNRELPKKVKEGFTRFYPNLTLRDLDLPDFNTHYGMYQIEATYNPNYYRNPYLYQNMPKMAIPNIWP